MGDNHMTRHFSLIPFAASMLLLGCGEERNSGLSKPDLDEQLMKISSSVVAGSDLIKTLEDVDRFPIIESPNYWVKIIEDTTRDEKFRKQIFQYFMHRFFKTGDDFLLNVDRYGISSWIISGEFVDQSSGSAVPVPRASGGSVYYLMTPKTTRARVEPCVWISFATRMDKDKIIDSLLGNRPNGLVIMGLFAPLEISIDK